MFYTLNIKVVCMRAAFSGSSRFFIACLVFVLFWKMCCHFVYVASVLIM